MVSIIQTPSSARFIRTTHASCSRAASPLTNRLNVDSMRELGARDGPAPPRPAGTLHARMQPMTDFKTARLSEGFDEVIERV